MKIKNFGQLVLGILIGGITCAVLTTVILLSLQDFAKGWHTESINFQAPISAEIQSLGLDEALCKNGFVFESEGMDWSKHFATDYPREKSLSWARKRLDPKIEFGPMPPNSHSIGTHIKKELQHVWKIDSINKGFYFSNRSSRERYWYDSSQQRLYYYTYTM